MRIAAALLVATAFTLGGFFLRDALRRSVRICSLLCDFFKVVQSEMLCLQKSFPQVLSTLEADFSSLSFPGEVHSLCTQGVDFPTAWERAVTAFLRVNPLFPEQGRMLRTFASSISTADAETAKRIFSLYEERMQLFHLRARQREQSMGTLCVRVGAMVGLLIGILIV